MDINKQTRKHKNNETIIIVVKAETEEMLQNHKIS